jgi:hypothetical protein
MRRTLAVVSIVAARRLQWATNNKDRSHSHNTPGLLALFFSVVLAWVRSSAAGLVMSPARDATRQATV